MIAGHINFGLAGPSMFCRKPPIHNFTVCKLGHVLTARYMFVKVTELIIC